MAAVELEHPSAGGGTAQASIWQLLVATAGAVILALSFGLNYGVSNHNTYLLGALRLVHPELLNRDWLATQTTDYHRHFAYLAAGLLHISENGWPFAVASLLLTAGGALVIFLIVRSDEGTPWPVLAFLLVVGFAALTGTYSVGESYLFSGILQPSTLGATGMLVAVYLFMRGRFVFSGAALGVGGFFHVNFLVLGMPVFLLAHLLGGGRGLPGRVARQLVPAALLALPALPLVLSAAAGGNTAGGLDVLFEIRSPHHYDPGFFRREFLALAGWLALLVLSLPQGDLRRRSSGSCRRRGAFVVSLFALLLGVGFLTVAFEIRMATQLYVWRLAPLLVLFTQIYLARAFLRLLAGRPYDGLLRHSVLRWACSSLGAGLLLFYYWRYSREDYLLAVAGVLVVTTLGALLARAQGAVLEAARPRSLASAGAVLAVITAFCLATVPVMTDLRVRSSLLTSRPRAEESLYHWARATDPDSVYLIPPQLDDFRLQARRAVVVDWKSTPLLPAELNAWYERLSAVSGDKPPRSAADAARGYSVMTAEEFRKLQTRFAVSYVLVMRTPKADLPDEWALAFRNERFEVWQP